MTEQSLANDHNPIEVSLVLPCYNEAEHIEESVPSIIDILDTTRWVYEIIFVEDVSQDNTRELVQSLIKQYPDHNLSAIYHESNTGRGQAVQDGFQQAAGEIVGYIDIDLEVQPYYIPACVLKIKKGADICTGHRIYRLSLPRFLRHILSRGYVWLTQQILDLPYQDTETGYKFFTREAALTILKYTQNKGWFWDTESMVYAHRLGYHVIELPCLFTRRISKTSTVKPLRDSIEYWQNLLQFARRLKTEQLQPIKTELGDQ